jgi:hypothetical protein
LGSCNQIRTKFNHSSSYLGDCGKSEADNILPFKWVFSIKRNEEGEVEKYKARLVVGGHKQKFGVDYDEVYAAVAKYQTVRFLLAFATLNSWEVFQLDYKTAFLNGRADKVLYMEPPPGLNMVSKSESMSKNFWCNLRPQTSTSVMESKYC